MPNLLIPCSGPGTRSIGYTKFHKALIRIGDCAVIDHIINSFADIDKIYITLGYEAEYSTPGLPEKSITTLDKFQ